jgi:hypothetical protein
VFLNFNIGLSSAPFIEQRTIGRRNDGRRRQFRDDSLPPLTNLEKSRVGNDALDFDGHCASGSKRRQMSGTCMGWRTLRQSRQPSVPRRLPARWLGAPPPSR